MNDDLIDELILVMIDFCIINDLNTRLLVFTWGWLLCVALSMVPRYKEMYIIKAN
jgi:hypothetical protein